jgi:hypothetical protein
MTALFSDPGAVAKKQATQARVQEVQRQDRIRGGTDQINSTFGQFDDGYYGRQQQNFLDYATPQLEDQYGKAKQQLTYSLARSGGLDSSARSAQEGQLQQAYDTAKRGISDQALSYSNQSRNSVEDARAGLISALNATGDAAQVGNQAISRATALSQPQAFSPIGQLFGDFTSALGTQAAAEKATALSGGVYRSQYGDLGLFHNADSVKNRA